MKKKQEDIVTQREKKTLDKRMRSIMLGVEKNFIDLKKKPTTRFDELFLNKYPRSKAQGKNVTL